VITPVQAPSDGLCRDSNPDFCNSIAQKPEYCGEHVIVNNKRVIEICPVTCKACDRILEIKNGQNNVIKKIIPQQVIPRPALPSDEPSVHVPIAAQAIENAACKDTNIEFCKSIVNKKDEFCTENVIVNKQKVIDICPLTCGKCLRPNQQSSSTSAASIMINFPINGIIPSNMDFDRKHIMQSASDSSSSSMASAPATECKDTNPEFCRTVALKKREYCNENVIVGAKKVLDVCMLSCNACDRLNSIKKVAPGPPQIANKPEIVQPVFDDMMSLSSGQKTFCSDFNMQFCSYISNRREFCTEEAVVKGQKVLDIW
jgi:hypothetical protein